jgi:predicted  nucleic acid-binding Zn-ribbon protein
VLEGLKQLIELQEIDDALASAEAEHARLPERRAELAAALEEATTAVEAARQSLSEREAEQRRAEDAVQDQRALKARLEGQQHQVKTNEAYTALLHELAEAERAIDAGETRILECLDACDEIGRQIAAAEQRRAALQQRSEEEGRALDAREEQLSAQISEHRAARLALCEAMSGELIEPYEKVASRRRPAVVRVGEEICGGCRVHLPPQLQIELIRGERLITCSNCERILVPAAPGAK